MNKRLMLTALLLSSLSISGYAYGAERMIVNQGDSASIISQTISGVIANNTDHGAVVFSKGNLTVSDSKFDSNEGRSNYLMGGAIFTGGTATVTNSEFTNNKSSYGAAIYNQANLTVENSKFINNSIHHFNDAFDAGAAIDNNDACNVVLNVNNSYFEGNSNGSRNGGGAIYFGSVSDIQSKISNSIFSISKPDLKKEAIKVKTPLSKNILIAKIIAITAGNILNVVTNPSFAPSKKVS